MRTIPTFPLSKYATDEAARSTHMRPTYDTIYPVNEITPSGPVTLTAVIHYTADSPYGAPFVPINRETADPVGVPTHDINAAFDQAYEAARNMADWRQTLTWGDPETIRH